MKVREYNPDCGYGWMVVFACFVINFIMAGLARAAGVLYIALIQDYAVSRELATAPFSLRYCVRNLSGPLVGALGQRFGVRPIVLLGGLVCGIGGIICSIAPDITWITIAWGGLHGLGYGMCNIIHVIVINRYFLKYKGLALGISLAGDCFGTFLLPVLLEFLLSVYDLKGTFLILAGISLNVVPAAMILKPPPWEEKDGNEQLRKENSGKVNVQSSNTYGLDNQAFEYTEDGITFKNKKEYSNLQLQPGIIQNCAETDEKKTEMHICSSTCGERKLLDNIQVAGNPHLEICNHKTVGNKCEENTQRASSRRLFDKTEKNGLNRYNFPVYDMHRKNSNISVLSCPTLAGKPTVEYLCKNVIADHLFLTPRPNQQTNNSFETPTVFNKSHAQVENSAVVNGCPLKLSKSSEMQKNFSVNNIHNGMEFSNGSPLEKTTEPICDGMSTKLEQENAFKNFIKTNLKPIFLLICVDFALFVFLFIAIFTIIIDYASDNNVPTTHGKYLIIAFSVTDLFGRIGFGFVLDKQWIALSYYAGLSSSLMGLFIFIMPFSNSFIFWITSFSLCGFIQGGVAIRYPILIEHYMEKNEETVALGCLNFYGGLLMLPIPPMIGYFRDIIGSYDGVFWTTGGLCILAGFLWLLEPCLVRRQQNKKEIFAKHCDKGNSQIM